MLRVRHAEDRGSELRHGVRSRLSFSCGDYIDRSHHHFRALRAINEHRIEPGERMDRHEHRDMEILSWILAGRLQHEDSFDHAATLEPGRVQCLTSGIGIEHQESNPDPGLPCRVLQIWVLPGETGGPPSYATLDLPSEDLRNRLRLIASPDGRERSLVWKTDTWLRAARLEAGASVDWILAEGRHGWIQVTRGQVEVQGLTLRAGDGASVSEESLLCLTAQAESEVLLFDLA